MPNLVSSYVVIYHCKSERSVLAVQSGPFRWVRFGPILGGVLYVAPLIRAYTVQLPWTDLEPRAEMSSIVNCDWIAPGEAESDFVLQRWIGFGAVQQIFLFFSTEYPLRSFTIDLHPLICRIL